MRKIICNDTNEICTTYQEYLDSEHWKRLKMKYRLAKFPLKCYACKSETNLNLHHKSYDRLGDERLQDLIYLCKNCHGEAHKLLKDYFDDLIIVSIKEKVYTEKSIRIWCGAKCKGNSLGWAAIIEYKDYRKEISGCAKRGPDTIFSIVLLAAIEALNKLKEPCDVTIITKDACLIKGINYKIDYWYKRRTQKIKNKNKLKESYWKQLSDLKEKHNITAFYSNGLNPYINRVNDLAREKARLLNIVLYKEVVAGNKCLNTKR